MNQSHNDNTQMRNSLNSINENLHFEMPSSDQESIMNMQSPIASEMQIEQGFGFGSPIENDNLPDLDFLMNMPVPTLRRSSGFNTFQYSDLQMMSLFSPEKPKDQKEFESTFSTEQEKTLPAQEKYQCKICYEGFNLGTKRPLVLSCGHSICASCAFQIYKGDVLICPFDKKMHKYMTLKDVPQNFTLLEAIEQEQIQISKESSKKEEKLIDFSSESICDISTDGSENGSEQITNDQIFEKVSKRINFLAITKDTDKMKFLQDTLNDLIKSTTQITKEILLDSQSIKRENKFTGRKEIELKEQISESRESNSLQQIQYQSIYFHENLLMKLDSSNVIEDDKHIGINPLHLQFYQIA